MLAKWQAIPEPIIPDPITATFFVRFIVVYIYFILDPNSYRVLTS
jgi:hypothetical protein